jgi:tRNA(His) guanylyltransferase
MHDALGDRMKHQYERRAATYLPRRTWTVLRLDGKAFHSYTRGLDRPYDRQLMEDMSATAMFLCEQVQGCRLAYTQSDEISLILTDFETPGTQAWFDGNVQKMVSVSASLATAKFNELRPGKLAFFDSRAFTIPDPIEVVNYLVWRQKDATRNSISMAAQAHFPHKQLHEKTSAQMQEMLWSAHGVNWNDYDPRFKRGTLISQETVIQPATYVDRRTQQVCTTDAVERRVWIATAPPVFTQVTELVRSLIDPSVQEGDQHG